MDVNDNGPGMANIFGLGVSNIWEMLNSASVSFLSFTYIQQKRNNYLDIHLLSKTQSNRVVL